MATPKLDMLCLDFIKRVPDRLRNEFNPGQGTLPDGNFIRAEVIIDYVNRGMMDLFNFYWNAVEGNSKKFISIFPELVKVTGNVSLIQGNYIIDQPYKDFFKVIGAVTASGNKFIKVKDEHLYTIYLSGEYAEYTANTDNLVIIQVNKMLAVFPQNFTGQIKIHYIRSPLDPYTGGYLIQNGSEDSPFMEHWHKQIIDYAYFRYLQETYQTS